MLTELLEECGGESRKDRKSQLLWLTELLEECGGENTAENIVKKIAEKIGKS